MTGPANCTLTLNADGSFDYTHDGSETTVDSFTYTASDGNGGQISQTFTWTVDNPGPNATDNTGMVTHLTNESDSGNVISDNDGFGVDSDPDGDTLTVNAVEGSNASVGVTVTGDYGSIVINNDGTIASLNGDHRLLRSSAVFNTSGSD